ncbi:hypothetical protein [Nitrosomonas sp.]|uniref:hypothetical protein n=1 Tax=Nitrosomonas sp. TaxID=42353 RepID=UPI00272FFDFA|nr:hypothetical protein [Nitrosomonas sp.]MDP2224882.1 hypothetical protein [Nitrosomonas sp.]
MPNVFLFRRNQNKSLHCSLFDRLLMLATIILISLSFNSFSASPDEITGELDVIHKDDFDNHIHLENDYFLRDDNGIDWYQLHFDRTPPDHLRSGQRIRVKGRQNGRKFRVESLEEQSSANGRGSSTGVYSTTTDSASTADAMAIDERRAVVIMVDLTNAKTGSYTTPAQVAGKMFTDTRSVDGLYREASLGQMSFPADTDGDGKPDVFGPFAINYDNATCDYYSWAYAAEAAAQLAGVDLSLYRHRVFVLPTSLPACSWNGIANVGCGTFCRAWVAGSSGTIFAHELGHNLNMAHAGSDPENDSTINNVYGDVSDPMGSAGSSWRLFNAAHMDQMGWYANIPGAISTITSSGTFNLAAIGLDPSSVSGSPFMLKIAKSNTSDLYYLSYRQPVGNYNQLSTTYTKGISIHRYKGSGYGYTTHIKTLIDGETFTDTNNGISFTQVSQGNGFATVQVSYGCAANTPTVSISPATLAMTSGNSANFTVTVSNKDMSGCSNTTFTLDYEGGVVNGSLASPDLTLPPSQTGSSILTADTYLSEGSYPLSVVVTDSDGRAPHHTVISQGNATLVIDSTPPSTPANLSGSVNKQGNNVLSWQAATDSLSGIADYPIYRNNELIGYVTGTGYTDNTAVSGVNYEYAVSARDKAGNISSSSSILLSTSSTRGGGKK